MCLSVAKELLSQLLNVSGSGYVRSGDVVCVRSAASEEFGVQ